MPWRRKLLWRLTITRGALYVTWVCANSFRLCTEPRKPFPELGAWDRFVVLAEVAETGIPVLLAFIDKTTARLADSDEGEDDTKFLAKLAKTAAVATWALFRVALVWKLVAA